MPWSRHRLTNTLVVIAALAAISLAFRGMLSRALSLVQRPLVVAGTWVSSHTVGLFDSAVVAPERLARLESERDAAVIDHAELVRLREENEELRASIGFAGRARVRSVVASIVSRSIGPEASAFVIDRGTADGIEVGDPAVTGDGVLVGKIVSANAGSATVRVIADRDSTIAVALLNGTRTIGVAQGLSGSLLTLRYIPQDERIDVNDIVVTSGLEERVPDGLVVGVVNSVTGDPAAPFQEAVVEPLGDVRRVHTVSILVGEAL